MITNLRWNEPLPWKLKISDKETMERFLISDVLIPSIPHPEELTCERLTELSNTMSRNGKNTHSQIKIQPDILLYVYCGLGYIAASRMEGLHLDHNLYLFCGKSNACVVLEYQDILLHVKINPEARGIRFYPIASYLYLDDFSVKPASFRDIQPMFSIPYNFKTKKFEHRTWCGIYRQHRSMPRPEVYYEF